MIDYYQQYDSWVAVKEKAKTFSITTMYDSQREKVYRAITSSAIPIEGLEAVESEIAQVFADKTAWRQWNKDTKTLTVIPYTQIVAITISFD